MSVGIARTLSAPASSGCASVSTFAHTMSSCLFAAASKVGANMRHGAHQLAQKSMTTIPSFLMVSMNVSVVSAIGFMNCS